MRDTKALCLIRRLSRLLLRKPSATMASGRKVLGWMGPVWERRARTFWRAVRRLEVGATGALRGIRLAGLEGEGGGYHCDCLFVVDGCERAAREEWKLGAVDWNFLAGLLIVLWTAECTHRLDLELLTIPRLGFSTVLRFWRGCSFSPMRWRGSALGVTD